ncbi:unnamed protein product [Vitrella brassicaformis CCMP3155]|uniref:Uncharacterized protein n=1 Tax=Vitrella brassicaformis (strain CCMP3155) TaxID=1169540 RepID=A0A0G4EHM8_VITBC|nr:unnamed protein product [Vitrella brassicaformis CCMP3155]|eukprot:CEL95690.1 unnamed protein product [Vitrella brassicaformis CCMP3155]
MDSAHAPHQRLKEAPAMRRDREHKKAPAPPKVHTEEDRGISRQNAVKDEIMWDESQGGREYLKRFVVAGCSLLPSQRGASSWHPNTPPVSDQEKLEVEAALKSWKSNYEDLERCFDYCEMAFKRCAFRLTIFGKETEDRTTNSDDAAKRTRDLTQQLEKAGEDYQREKRRRIDLLHYEALSRDINTLKVRPDLEKAIREQEAKLETLEKETSSIEGQQSDVTKRAQLLIHTWQELNAHIIPLLPPTPVRPAPAQPPSQAKESGTRAAPTGGATSGTARTQTTTGGASGVKSGGGASSSGAAKGAPAGTKNAFDVGASASTAMNVG